MYKLTSHAATAQSLSSSGSYGSAVVTILWKTDDE